MNYISTEWPIIWVLGVTTLSFIMAFILYKKSFFDSYFKFRRLLFGIRFTSIFIITFLLLKPYINQFITHKEKPIVLIGVDNSSSVFSALNNNNYKQFFLQNLDNFNKGLDDNFQIETYSFGEKVKHNPLIDFKDRKSNLSNYLNEISDIYSNRNVVANIIASDGIYNSGSNPIYANYSFNAPLYTIFTGDTTIKKDLELSNISYNQIAYLGNSFPIEATVNSKFCEGETIQLSLWDDKLLLQKKEYLISKNNESYTFDFQISANSTGTKNYLLEIKSLDDEHNLYNNKKNIFVDILESKQKILLLSDFPHPDIAAISSSIKKNKNYELVASTINEFNGKFSSYSLIIAFQTTSINTDLPIFYFLGNKSSAFELDWFSYEPLKKSLNKVKVDHNQFSLFSLNDKWRTWIYELPPLYSPFAEYTFNSKYYQLFTQNILGIPTQNPIFAFSQNNGVRQAVCVAEGLWKWRIYEYLKTNEQILFDELINKSIQFLSIKDDKRPLRFKHDNLVYENETLMINAEVYDANYNLINHNELNILVTDQNGRKYNYSFNKSEQSYFLELNGLKVGNYKYQSKVIQSGKELIYNGQFSIIPLNLEKMNTIGDPQLLSTLSLKYGGKSFDIKGFNNLLNEISKIESNIQSYIEESKNDLINFKWIFTILLLLLSLEWFLRKKSTKI